MDPVMEGKSCKTYKVDEIVDERVDGMVDGMGTLAQSREHQEWKRLSLDGC